MSIKHEPRAKVLVIGIIVVVGLLATVAGGLAGEPTCSCEKTTNTEVCVRLSPDIQFPSILTRCTGYVQLYSSKTSISNLVKLPAGEYFLDFTDVKGLSSLCTDCALEGEHDCQATEVKYEVSIDGAAARMNNKKVAFSIDDDTKTTLITIVIEYKCADTTTAERKCNTVSCKQTLYFRFARAPKVCDCSAVGFTATILKNNSPVASTTYLPILNPPSGTTDLYIEYKATASSAAVGAAAPRLAKGDTIAIKVSGISVLCLCKDTVCPNSDDDPNVSFSKGSGTSTKRDATWVNNHTVYQGTVEITGDPSKGYIYITVTYHCHKTENCTGRIYPPCSRKFKFFLRPEA
jgi:hypothetical protein